MAYKQKGWSPFTKASPLKFVGKLFSEEAKQKRKANRAFAKKKAEIIMLSKLPWNKGKFAHDRESRQWELDKARKGITTGSYLDAKYKRRGAKSYFADEDVMGAPTDWRGASHGPIPDYGDKSKKMRKQLVKDKIQKDAMHYSARSPKTYTKEYIKSKFSKSTRDYKKALKKHGYK